MTASPLLERCRPSLPRAAYLDPGWFEHEMRAVFAREWVCIGREGDFPPGTITPVTVAGQGAIVVHGADGLRAFHNVCPHRGAELCAAARPLRGKLITCPYHAWAFATDGRLVSTAFATPGADFDRTTHGLTPVRTTVWAGCVFLSLAGDPPPFAPDLGLAALDAWPMRELVTAHTLTRRIACNWKLFWENYNECLHCPGVHPALAARVPIYARGVMAPAERRGWDGAPVPALQAGADSWTVSGAPAAAPFPGLGPAERAEGHRFVTLLPSAFVVAHVDQVRLVTLAPLGPEETLLTARWLLAPGAAEAPGFDLAEATGLAARR